MAYPTLYNPLSFVINRQINDKINHRQKLVKARFEHSENLFRKNLLSHYGCVNAIEFSKYGDLLVSGGDDRRVLLWKVEQAIQGTEKPAVMRAEHTSNIFCLGFDNSTSKIFSAGNDDQVIVHNLQTGDPLNYFLHEKAVFGLSIHPQNDFVFGSACDDGRILIYDIRGSKESLCLAQYKSAFHSVMFNPIDSKMLATANAKEGASIWDIRKPLKPVLQYGTEGPSQSCMYVRFNSAGNKLLALRRRLPPILYSIDSPKHLCQFDHYEYYNSCTMKSCCFAGDNDEYVLSGSDDFNLYMWKIPADDIQWVDSAHMKLCGHRSIVNQVRYNKSSCILASSGVEKMIKLWSPFSLGYECLGGLKKNCGIQEKQRRVFAHSEYIELVLRSGHFMTHDYSHQSTKEDPRMMAFFDSLVQREIEDWSSEDVTAPQTPSDNDNSLVNNTFNATDSDDSTASDRQLMLSFLGPTVNSRNISAGMAPERSSKSPNRITRLIINCRTKLMRLAGKEIPEATISPNANGTSVVTTSETGSTSKLKSKLKGAKRKASKSTTTTTTTTTGTTITTTSASRIRKRSSTLIEIQNDEHLDTVQPSTSSGLVSQVSKYNSTSYSDKQSSESNSDDNDNDGAVKRKITKVDLDSSPKCPKKKHKKCKHHAKRESGKSCKKKQKVENDSDDEWWKEIIQGTKSESNQNETPAKRTNKLAKQLCSTPDSGMGISTSEKSQSSAQSNSKSAETSDDEENLRTFQSFKKKVDAIKRTYRKRTMSEASDSSD